MKAGIAALLLLLMALASPSSGGAAEVPRLLADINTTPVEPDPFANRPLPSGFFQLGGRLLFSTANPNSEDGGMLWSTDGTPEGVEVVSPTLCPSPCQRIEPVATLGDAAFLKVSGAALRLWRTDGTAAGTRPLTPPLTGIDSPVVSEGPGGGRLYFVGCLPEGGCEVWRSDGTRAGTQIVKDLSEDDFGSNPYGLVTWAGRLYFIAGGTGGFGLWSTDGSAEGTRFVAEVGEPFEGQSRLVATPSHLFFTSGIRGEDLWVTDGTPEGTRLLKDLEEPQCGGHPFECGPIDIDSLFVGGDAAYFVVLAKGAPSELWRSDGTAAGTRSILTFPAGVSPSPFQRLADQWIFVATRPAGGITLWKADDGLTRVEPITLCEGGACPEVFGFLGLSTDPGHVLFLGRDAAHGIELWITDATGAGTRRLTDACPGACDGVYFDYYRMAPIGSRGKVWFAAYDHPAGGPNDDELWVTDGTPGGTHRVAGHALQLGFLGDLAFFGTDDGSGPELRATDGTPAGTRRVARLTTFAPGSSPIIVPLRAGALMLADDGSGVRLWRSDGTPAGTFPLAELAPEVSFSPFPGPLTAGALTYFDAYRRVPGNPEAFRLEIWRTNGTTEGTRPVAMLGHSIGSTGLRTAWNGKLLLLVQKPDQCAFWSSDGTPAGTREILPMPPGIRCPTAVQPFGSGFLFVARTADFVPQIFLSDGTPGGTRQISAIRGSRDALDFGESAVAGGVVFFTLRDRTYYGSEVWRTDGAAAGTHRAFKLPQPGNLKGFRGSLYFTAPATLFGPRFLWRAPAKGGAPVMLATVRDIDYNWLPGSPDDARITPAGDRLFFVVDADEIWVTDGTLPGTRRVLDIRAGAARSDPSELTAAGDRIFFTANDGEHGRELWVSDGTPGGTRMVQDLNPGGFSSLPTGLTVSGSHLFFAADDGVAGAEPWALSLEPR